MDLLKKVPIRSNIPILYYHRVGYPRKSTRKLFVPLENFRAQMSFLKRNRFNIIPLDDLVSKKSTLPEKSVCITFDDGYSDLKKYALSVLTRYNFVATFFIVTSFIGKTDDFNCGRTAHREKLMDFDDLKMLIKCGMQIGSHSVSHRVLTNISDNELKKEAFESKKVLEDALGINVNFFAYPKGEYNEHVIDHVKKAGYKAAFTTTTGKANNIMAIGRIPVSHRTNFARFLIKILK